MNISGTQGTVQMYNVPQPKQPTIIEKVVSFTKAVTSGEASEDIQKQRNEQCNSCEKLKRIDDKRFCGACGCGQNTLSELSVKLKFAYLECPLKKAGFSNATPDAVATL